MKNILPNAEHEIVLILRNGREYEIRIRDSVRRFSETDIQPFRTSPVLQQNVLRALERMLKFYGIALRQAGEDLECQEGADFEGRRRLWLTPKTTTTPA